MYSLLSTIYLIGYRCTGKSTVGRNLAGLRGWTYLDTDKLVAAGEQMSIAQIVDRHSWTHFRKLETKYLRQAAAAKNSVIATGGGIVLQPGNITCMQASGVIIWLRATPEVILERMMQDPATAVSRPALTRQALADEVTQTLAARRDLYRDAADFSLQTDAAKPDKIAARIQARLTENTAPDLGGRKR